MKVQFWSFDLVFAIIIFILAMVVLTFVWVNINNEFSISFSSNVAHMQSQLVETSGQIMSSGYPFNWEHVVNTNNPPSWANISIGLGNGTYGGLSFPKIRTLSFMSESDYQATKAPLGLAYDYYITITGSGMAYSIGINPSSENVTSVQVERFPAVLNGNPVTVQIQLWSNSTLGIE